MTRPEAELLDAIAAASRTVPGAVMDTFCDALTALVPDSTADSRTRLLADVSQPAAREALAALIVAWRQKAPQLAPAAMAWALKAASTSDDHWRRWQSVELVWTGPVTGPTSLRRTEQALLELIRGAHRSLYIVTFAAYKIPEVAVALAQAAERNVAITVIIEPSEAHGGKVFSDSLPALGDALSRRATFYIWPPKRRPRDASGRHGSLHMKCAVADGTMILISSANLTDSALNLNMELGVLLRGGDIPARVADHLLRLVRAGILTPMRPPDASA